MLTVSAPTWSLKGSTEVEVDEGGNESDDSSNIQDSQDLLWEKVERWLKGVESLSNTTLPSGIFLGKVWTRIYFSLHNAAQELKGANFGTVMEIFALCVLNAFLVEEAEHHMSRSSSMPTDTGRIDRSNPRKSVKNFLDKIVAVQPRRIEFPFTSIMATCPLLLGLLDEKKGYSNALKPMFPDDFSIQDIGNLLCPNVVFKQIEKVSITGEGSPIGRGASRSRTKTVTAGDSGTGAGS
ncbi:MAG: hypothetical protein DI538_29245 [Azospira oryzae]|nr:MAG: hypothetical protein DI538_29245 [Azospira oryzae]